MDFWIPGLFTLHLALFETRLLEFGLTFFAQIAFDKQGKH